MKASRVHLYQNYNYKGSRNRFQHGLQMCKKCNNIQVTVQWLWGLNIFNKLKFHLTSSDSYAGLNVVIFHWLVCWAGLHLYTVWLISFIVHTHWEMAMEDCSSHCSTWCIYYRKIVTTDIAAASSESDILIIVPNGNSCYMSSCGRPAGKKGNDSMWM